MLTGILKLLAIAGALLYSALFVLVLCYQDYLVFPGTVLPIGTPAAPEHPGATTERIQIRDGRNIRVAVTRPPQAEAPTAVLVYFVGNAEGFKACRFWADRFAETLGVSVWSPEYPGYGTSGGRAAKETSLEAADLTAKLARTEARRLGVPFLVGGHSLGTFMAVHVAAQGFASKLLLTSPPTSIRERGEDLFPFLPVRYLLHHDFDNAALAGKIQCPTLVVHGDLDRIVPIAEGRRLSQAIRGATLCVVAGGSHNPYTLYQVAGDRVRRFLRSRR